MHREDRHGKQNRTENVKKGELNYEKIYENNGRKLLRKKSGSFGTYRKREYACRIAEEKFLHTAERISQILLGCGGIDRETQRNKVINRRNSKQNNWKVKGV